LVAHVPAAAWPAGEAPTVPNPAPAVFPTLIEALSTLNPYMPLNHHHFYRYGPLWSSEKTAA
jgi:hypothetical protein